MHKNSASFNKPFTANRGQLKPDVEKFQFMLASSKKNLELHCSCPKEFDHFIKLTQSFNGVWKGHNHDIIIVFIRYNL